MPPSTAAAVNQFPNPKVSDGERRGRKGKAKGPICYSSLGWSVLRLFHALFCHFFVGPSSTSVRTSEFWAPSIGINWLTGGSVTLKCQSSETGSQTSTHKYIPLRGAPLNPKITVDWNNDLINAHYRLYFPFSPSSK